MSDSRALLHRSDDEWAARECAHPDCDGWRHHDVIGIKDDATGTWTPACANCGPLEVVGSWGSEAGARKARADHNGFQRCAGECRAWFKEDRDAA